MIYIEGWLEKKTRHVFPRVWKKRYGVLSLHDGKSTFNYFEDECQTTLKGSINIFSSSKIRIGEQQHLKKNNQIIVYVNPEVSFIISLESEQCRDEWLNAFQRLLLDTFDHLTGNEELLSENNQLRAAALLQEEKETLRELVLSTTLYRAGAAISYECQDRIVCLDPSDITMYDLGLTDKAPLRTAARSCPSRHAVPILVMHLCGFLDIPSEVVHTGIEHIVILRSRDATLRIVFCSASTANAWLDYLVFLRNNAQNKNRQYQSSGLTRLATMIPTTITNTSGAAEEIIYNIFDYDVKSNTDTETAPTPTTTATAVQVVEEEKISLKPSTSCLSDPPMFIIILVVGTRGDVQPFVYLGLELQRRGHTVRIGTHQEYRDFIVGEGLLFYPLGGDPRKLSEYMVKTKGRLIPDLTNSDERKDLPEKMAMMRDITFSCWPACTAPDPQDPSATPFLADAIISNPVTYGHIHCAEALAVPLHIMFPQPWYPTKAFPHPISNVLPNVKWSIANRMTYKAFDEFMWAGMKGIINDFRRQILKLSPLRTGEGGDSLLTSKDVPISHMWSRYLVPSCVDWPSHVNVVGEFTRVQRRMVVSGGGQEDTAIAATSSSNVATTTSSSDDDNDSMKSSPAADCFFQPDPRLQQFLESCETTTTGVKPVYVGFGSMVIEDPQALVAILKEATASLNISMILQSGWTKYANDYSLVSDRLMVVGALPHDWLFSQVSAVIHHGGAGTTSAGLRAGNPTWICPFFGDQHFWAEMVYRAGAGPPGCPIVRLTVPILKDALLTLTSEEVRSNAAHLSIQMNSEEGVLDGIQSFVNALPLPEMICEVSIFMGKSDLAKVYCRDCGLKMSVTADAVLHRDQSGRTHHQRFPYRTMNWRVRPTDIQEGVSQGFGCALYEIAGGVLGLVNRPMEELRNNDNVVLGLSKGIAKGIGGLIARPIKAGGILTSKIVESIFVSTHNEKKTNVFTLEENMEENMQDTQSIIKDFFEQKLRLPDVPPAVYDPDVKIFQLEEALYRAVNFHNFWRLMAEGNDRVIGLDALKCFIPLEEAEAVIALGGTKLDNSITFAELAYCLTNHVNNVNKYSNELVDSGALHLDSPGGATPSCLEANSSCMKQGQANK